MDLLTSIRPTHEQTAVAANQNAARDALRERQRQRVAMRSRMPELRRSDLRFERRWIVHVPDGVIFVPHHGDVISAEYHAFDAWFIGEGGHVAFLEYFPGRPTTTEDLTAVKRAVRQ